MLRPQQRAAIEQMELTGWANMAWTAGYTLLHWAARYGDIELVKFFIAGCGGGRTPWATWLSCEETGGYDQTGTRWVRGDGYVHETDPFGRFAARRTAIGFRDARGGSYDTQCDMFAVGIILYVVLSGYHPFDPDGLNTPDRMQSLMLRGLWDFDDWARGSRLGLGPRALREAQAWVRMVVVMRAKTAA